MIILRPLAILAGVILMTVSAICMALYLGTIQILQATFKITGSAMLKAVSSTRFRRTILTIMILLPWTLLLHMQYHPAQAQAQSQSECLNNNNGEELIAVIEKPGETHCIYNTDHKYASKTTRREVRKHS